jgi:hypothetical protein
MLAFSSPMKLFSAAVLLVCLTGCSTTTRRGELAAQADPVLIIYHVKPGAEKALEDVLKRAWQIYRRERMVFDQPHLCVRVNKDAEKVRFVEAFSWVSHFATEQPLDSAKQIWEEMKALCEDRGGNRGVEVRRAEILMP